MMTDSQLPAAATAQKFGTLIPNRIFVGGISAETTESELCRVFSAYGNVKSTKIIVDRAGVSKGYGFVTFETELEASRLHDGRCVILRDRKLNIAPAIKKQTFVAPNETIYYAAATHPSLLNNIPLEQFPQAAAALYSPGVPSATALYPPTMTPAYPFYQPFIQPMNVPAIWPPNYQAEIIKDFFVVLFSDNSIEAIRKEWIINEQLCYFPDSSKYYKYIKKNKFDMEKLKLWAQYEIKILKQFDTLDSAMSYTKNSSGFENSADEEVQRQQKQQARKHPVHTILPDLQKVVKRLKYDQNIETIEDPLDVSSPVDKMNEQQIDINQEVIDSYLSHTEHSCPNIFSTSITNQQEIPQSDLVDNNLSSIKQQEVPQNSQNINCFDSGINADSPRYVLVEEIALKIIIQSLDELKLAVKILTDAFMSGNLDLSKNMLTKKVNSKEELELLSEQLQKDDYKSKMVNLLKLKGGMSGFTDETNSKVAAILYYLFDKSFLKKMSWGLKNGVPRGEQICLIDWPKITELMREVLSKTNGKGEVIVVEDSKLRLSIQGVFKNHIHKKS